jgi:hypothetical protein
MTSDGIQTHPAVFTAGTRRLRQSLKNTNEFMKPEWLECLYHEIYNTVITILRKLPGE